jgi:hypothetical protein
MQRLQFSRFIANSATNSLVARMTNHLRIRQTILNQKRSELKEFIFGNGISRRTGVLTTVIIIIIQGIIFGGKLNVVIVQFSRKCLGRNNFQY